MQANSGAISGMLSLASTWQRFSSLSYTPHLWLRKKMQLPDRVMTDVQALSHPVAVIFHSHGHVPDPADENQTYSLPRVLFWFFPLLLLL